MKTYWIYFIGTSHGEYIEAANMEAAKQIFCNHEGVVMSSYIVGKNVRFEA